MKKIAKDFALNIVANILPVAILQIFILPNLSKSESATVYGSIVTMISFINMLAIRSGNSLNNTRLVTNRSYQISGEEGDFNPLVLFFCSFNVIIAFIGMVFFFNEKAVLHVLFMILAVVVVFAREYYIVAFRLALNYKHILISNIFLSCGYLCGFLIYTLCGYWQWIYIISYGLSLVHIFCKTELHKEKWKITGQFLQTAKKELTLWISTLLNGTTAYIDKLVLYALAGPVVTSVYYIASLLGKVISMGASPIATVFLSYLAKSESISKRDIKLVMLGTFGITLVMYLVCNGISPLAISWLYPESAKEAIQYVNYTMLTASAELFCVMLNAIIMRFYEDKWQIIVSSSTTVLYMLFTVILLTFYGLKGFCIGAVLAMMYKLCFLIVLCLYGRRKA